MKGIITFGGNVYRYDGVLFEDHHYCGPWPLKKDGEPKKLAGMGFFKRVQPFYDLPKEEREKYLVEKSPGCVRF